MILKFNLSLKEIFTMRIKSIVTVTALILIMFMSAIETSIISLALLASA